MNRGITLLELVTVLAVGGTLMGLAVGQARRVSDLAAVTSAREAFVAATVEARGRAIASGGEGARVIVVPGARAVLVSSPEGLSRRALGPAGVHVDVRPAGDSLTLRFDPLGVGRFANATLTFRRGASERSIIVSSYGRVRRP